MSARKTRCRSCGADVFMVLHKGNEVPVELEGIDVTSDPNGEVVGFTLDGLKATGTTREVMTLLPPARLTLHRPHHIKCPQGKQWKKKR